MPFIQVSKMFEDLNLSECVHDNTRVELHSWPPMTGHIQMSGAWHTAYLVPPNEKGFTWTL